MSSNKSLKKNFLYNLAYQLLLVVFPLVTVPYTSRVLGAGGVGTYSYTYSIVYYFMLFAMLGINNYGNREVAKYRDNKQKTSRIFWNIYAIQLIMTVVAMAAYAVLLMTVAGDNFIVLLIQGLCLVSVIFDYNWFFYGLEEFKVTVMRNFVVKLLSLVGIFTLVRTSEDLPIYTLIMAGGTLLGQMALVPYMRQQVEYVRPTWEEMKRHLKPCLVLFIPVVSVSLYNIMDKIMLGMMTNMAEVGYYAQAERIISIPLTLITALSTIMMPRMSALVAHDNHSQVYDFLEKSIIFMSLLTTPLSLGIMAIANLFIPIFLGPDYNPAIPVLILLSTVMLCKAIGSVFRMQYMTPHHMDREYAVTTMMGAVVNLIINILLIPHFQAIGACIGTIVSEVVVLGYMAYVLRNKLPLAKYANITIMYVLKGLVMFLLIIPVSWLEVNDYLKLGLEVVVGATIYLLLNTSTIKAIILNGKEAK